MLLRLINVAGERKVDSGWEILIGPHQVLASGKPVLQKSIQQEVFFRETVTICTTFVFKITPQNAGKLSKFSTNWCTIVSLTANSFRCTIAFLCSTVLATLGIEIGPIMLPVVLDLLLSHLIYRVVPIMATSPKYTLLLTHNGFIIRSKHQVFQLCCK